MKTLLRRIFLVATILLAGIYGLACLTPFISPAQWVVMGFLALGFPVLLAATLITAIVWLFIKKKISVVLLVIAAFGSYHILHLFGWNRSPFSLAKQAGTVRIMGWNVMNFEKDLFYDTSTTLPYRSVFKYVQQQQPDIICMQDFFEKQNYEPGFRIQQFQKSLGYPYYIFSADYFENAPNGLNHGGVAIFSKYPLYNAQRIQFKGKKLPQSILTADITIRNITRRIVVTHLQSMHLSNLALKDKASWAYDEDSLINYDNTLNNKLSFYLPYHVRQAEQVREVVANSPYPVIFSADMNEVPTSYCYHLIKGNMKDAFLEKGFGLGRTYYKISPTLRIDYLMHSPEIKVVQYKKDTVELSDHYPQIMDVQW